MGFQIKDLYTKSGAELITLLFSEQGLRENAVEFTEYVNKVGVLEVLDSNLKEAITSLDDTDYMECYLHTVEYSLEFMEEVRKCEVSGEKVPLVPAMWNILQSARKIDDYDDFRVSAPVFAEDLEKVLSSTDRIFEYAYATNVNFCSRSLGSDSMITDEYVDHLLNKYHYSQKDKEQVLRDYSLKHLEKLMDRAGIKPEDQEERIKEMKKKLDDDTIIGPIFMRMTKISKDELREIGETFMSALQDRSKDFDDFFDDEPKKEEKSLDDDEIPKDDSGNTLQ